jgi:diketogulonate reductase-like aldo/keto reductase
MGPPVMPPLGMGTWHMGEDPAARAAEVAALRLGLELGIGLIDTAEMYGAGGAEKVVGEAIRGRRDGVFVVSKFYPHHAGRRKLATACEGSLARLGIERLDLYLLHWRGNVPFAETVQALERLVEEGKVARWGVSNLDVDDMRAVAASEGGAAVAADQVLYNLAERGVEFDLLPWCAERDVAVMAYSPLDEGRLVRHPALDAVARRIGATPAQVAIAWLLDRPGVVAIPKAVQAQHVRAIAGARELRLDAATRAELDRAFPAPRAKQPLAVI